MSRQILAADCVKGLSAPRGTELSRIECDVGVGGTRGW